MNKLALSFVILLFLAGCANTGYNPGYIISDTSTEEPAQAPPQAP